MLTIQPHLRVRRPSPTTVEYTVSTRPDLSLALRLLLVLTTVLRFLLAIALFALLYTKYLLLTSTTLPSYTTPPTVASAIFPTYLLNTALSSPPVSHALTFICLTISSILLLPICASVLYLLTLRPHTTETLLILRGLGIQVSSSSLTYLSGSTTRFIPTEQVQDIFINEAFRGFEVRYYLGVVVEGEVELVVVFPKLAPGRQILEKVWRGGRGALFEWGDRAKDAGRRGSEVWK